MLLVTGSAVSGQAAGPRDFAVGSGSILSQSLQFKVTAHVNPRRLSGAVVVDYAGEPGKPWTAYSLRGPVTCLNVTGDHAIVGIRIQTATGTAADDIGDPFFVYIDDVARPGRDRYADSGFVLPAPSGCEHDAPAVHEVQQGNVAMNDGQS